MTQVITWKHVTPHLGRSTIAIGVFDGVHLGHQALINDTVALAHKLGVSSAVVTFDRDPDRVVSPETAAPQLLELDDKIELIGKIGPDRVLVVPFDSDLAAMTPEHFIDDILVSTFSPAAALVGHDFRFGRGAKGDVGTLQAHGKLHGFETLPHELLEVDGAPVTSTRIRALVAEGRMPQAARLLGRPHRVKGRVVRGRGVGTRLAAPTANLSVRSETALPLPGVYAALTTVNGRRYAVAASVGIPPTFPEAVDNLEAHILGFKDELRGGSLTLEFVERIRDHRRFADEPELAAAIAGDIERIAEITAPLLG